MKFFKLLWYDLRNGLFSKPARWVIVATLFALLFLIFSVDVLHWWWFDSRVEQDIRNINVIGLSFGDVVLTQLGGMLPIIFTTLADSFDFPVKWLLPHVLILYFTLNYVSEDLTHCGVQVLTRARSKNAWWLSKCIWNVFTVVSCFVVGIGVLYVFSFVTGKELGFVFNSEVFFHLMSEWLPEQNAGAWEYFMALCIMPCVVCVTVSLLQMVLSLFVKPVFAYIVSCVYYIAGAYYAHPLLISNFAMSSRSAVIGFYNFYAGSGLIICMVFSVSAVLIGISRLGKMDLINNTWGGT